MTARRCMLTLIGIVHLDPRGMIDLMAKVRRMNPSALTVEVSEWSLAWRRRQLGRALRRRVWKNVYRCLQPAEPASPAALLLRYSGLRPLLLQLELPWEWRMAAALGTQMKTPVYAVDSCAHAKNAFKDILKLTCRDNVKWILESAETTLAQAVSIQHDRMEKSFENDVQFYLDPEREAVLSQNIAQVCRGAGADGVIHVGGWEHLLPGRKGLMDRLQGWAPQGLMLGRNGKITTVLH